MVISVTKWQLLLYAKKINLSWIELWHAYWAGLFFNNFLPSSIGGDALRIIWVGKSRGDSSGAAASVIVERILATAGIITLSSKPWAYQVWTGGMCYMSFLLLR
jgi:uncharacterized membrane protein YbhN (UPF0104 family)